jgi:hypothetical protein
MRKWLGRQLTYANVMATLAVFLVLGGGTAVALNGSNTVQSDDLGPGAQVKAADIVTNAVNASKVQDGSLTAADANTTSLQRRIAGACPSGQAATSVTQAGGLTCGAIDGGIARGVDALFGDGSDGDVTISSTTLNRDHYYHDLTIDPGETLNPGGYRIFVSGTLTFGDGSKIARNGNNIKVLPSGGGAALSSGSLGGSGAGGDTSTDDGASVVNSLGGNGGIGDAANVGGIATPPAAAGGGAQVFDQAMAALSGRSLDGTRVNGGAGGGGSCCGTTGGGGGGGGVVVVVARRVALDGSAAITANGGGAVNGGAGGGGVVVVITSTPKPAGMTLSADSVGSHPGEPGFTAWLD